MQTDSSIGVWGEYYASRLYLAQGYQIIAKNSYNHKGKQVGEIDLVAVRKNQIVFVEVKTRINNSFGSPEEAVTVAKQKRLVAAVQWFLNQFPQFIQLFPRIDVCAIVLNQAAKNWPNSDLDKFVRYSKIITNAVELN